MLRCSRGAGASAWRRSDKPTDSTFRFQRRLCRCNLLLGEVSEGAVEAPSDYFSWLDFRSML